MTDYQTLHDLDLAHCFHPSTDLPAHHKRGPMIFAEGNGMWLKDIHGKEYLDCQAGLANCNFGHGNEKSHRPPMNRCASFSSPLPAPDWPRSH